MEQFNFSNADIDIACDKVGKFLEKAGVERREALRTKLSFEETLLEYQAKFGENALFDVRCTKRFPAIKVEIIVKGECFNPLDKQDGEEDEIIHGILGSIGLAPTWSYKNGKNYVVFIPKKKPLSSTVKMLLAILLAVAAGIFLNLLPEGVRGGVNDYLISPVTDAFVGLITAVSGPLIFLSVLGSICSMGNLETLGRVGSKTIKIILLYMTVIAACMTAFACLFYPVRVGSGGASDFSQILDLIYDIIPSNLFQPFVTGNALQLIFISVIVGLSMLALSSRVGGVFKLVEQLGSIVQTMMSGLSSILPVLIFVLFTGMISNGNFGAILSSWKILLVIVLMSIMGFALVFFKVVISRRVSPAVLFRKTWPTLMICLTTASSAASFSTNVRDSHKKLGIDKRLVDFGIPLGQVLFMPGFVAVLFGMALGFAEPSGVEVTLPWVIIGGFTSLLVSFAVPPVPGGAMMGFTVVFAQLGIPLEVMGVAIAINAIIDFPCTAGNVSTWQLALIDVADSLQMLDKETLRKK